MEARHNPSTGKAETGDPQGSLTSQSGQFSGLQANESQCLKGGGWYLRNDTYLLTSTQRNTHTHTHASMSQTPTRAQRCTYTQAKEKRKRTDGPEGQRRLGDSGRRSFHSSQSPESSGTDPAQPCKDSQSGQDLSPLSREVTNREHLALPRATVL